MRSEQAAANSAAKSRSLTASIEFVNAEANPSSFAVNAGSVENEVPAIAQAPSGLMLARFTASSNRPASRPSRSW
jgi:hypothetical protein